MRRAYRVGRTSRPQEDSGDAHPLSTPRARASARARGPRAGRLRRDGAELRRLRRDERDERDQRDQRRRSATSAASTGPSASATACGVHRTITVTGSMVSPPPSTVDVPAGCPVTLTVTADRTSEVHVHVVELEKPITAGTPLTLTFTPTQQGLYEVELHDPDLLLVKLAVR